MCQSMMLWVVNGLRFRFKSRVYSFSQDFGGESSTFWLKCTTKKQSDTMLVEVQHVEGTSMIIEDSNINPIIIHEKHMSVFHK